MADDRRDETSPPIDERTLDTALDRYLGRAVGEIVKTSLLQKIRREVRPDSGLLLQEIENLNPWLADRLREAVAGPRRDLGGEARTQRSTSARKGEK